MNDNNEIKKVLENIDNIPLLDDEDLKTMDFYELAYYAQALNQIDALANDTESDEVM